VSEIRTLRSANASLVQTVNRQQAKINELEQGLADGAAAMAKRFDLNEEVVESLNAALHLKGGEADQVLGDTLCIREEPELRHFLAHMVFAVRALVGGNNVLAEYELRQIDSMLEWDDEGDACVEKWLRARRKNGQGQEEEEGREALQGPVVPPRVEPGLSDWDPRPGTGTWRPWKP